MRLIDANALRENMQWCIDHGMYDKPYDYLAEIDDAPTVGEWIPCSERLPEDTTKPVLISGNYKGLGVYAVDIARYNGGMWQHDGVTFPDSDILAWMPLPEPYKAESEDKE